jgi:hypothetical protein
MVKWLKIEKRGGKIQLNDSTIQPFNIVYVLLSKRLGAAARASSWQRR